MKNSLLLVLSILFLYGCNKNQEVSNFKSFIIKGNIENVSDNFIVRLKTQENRVIVTLDSTKIIDGKFEFTGNINKPVIYGIFIDSLKGAIAVFMENKEIEIEAYKDSLESSKISGSITNNEYIGFVKKSKRITSKMNYLFPAFQKARSENDAKKLEDINKQMQAINNENTLFALKYAKQHKDSYIGAWALYSVLNVPTINKDTVAEIYNNFSDYVKKGDVSIKTFEFLNNNGVVIEP